MADDIGGLVFTIALIGGGIWLYNNWDDLGIRTVKYDECLLDKMKGQPADMLKTAEKYCRRAAKVEQYIGSTEPLWSGNHVTITDKAILDTWVVTTGSGAFSAVECSKVGSDDYKSVSLKFSNGTAALPDGSGYKCMQRMMYISGYAK